MTAALSAPVQAAPTLGVIPASAAWRPGDPVGERRFAPIGDLTLESGDVVPDAVLAYQTWGTLAPGKDNAVYIAHALTGDADAAAWWGTLIGPGRPLDTDRLFVVSANVIGGCQGSTGPASLAPDGRPWGSRFPWPTIRDHVEAERRLADILGIRRWRLIAGPSMGGMRALEWAVTYPDRVGGIAVMGTTAATTAEQLAWGVPQMAAIQADPKFRGGDYYDAADGDGPHVGLGIARQIAHITYRSEAELAARFGREVQADGRFAVASYLEHHAQKLARRFDANTYLRLVNAINSHDVGRGRGGVAAALARYRGPALVVAVDSDRLYPEANARELVSGLVGANEIAWVHSGVGHDGFLVESEQFNAHVRAFERSLQK